MIQVLSESIKRERRSGHEAYITIRKGRILQITGRWADQIRRAWNRSLSGGRTKWCQSHCESLSDCRWRRIYAGLYRRWTWAHCPCGFRFRARWAVKCKPLPWKYREFLCNSSFPLLMLYERRDFRYFPNSKEECKQECKQFVKSRIM